MNAKELKEKLFYDRKNGCLCSDDEVIEAADKFCEGYKDFLNKSKTERESADYFLEKLIANGYEEFSPDKVYTAGDKVYYCNRNKAIICAIIGKNDIADGVKIAAAHIDSPRLDLKPVPVYEDKEIALFKTHYYGGIKKYQWTAIPLSLHGVIYKADGEAVKINIGEDEKDPVFCVTDLLPHLATDQMKRTLNEGIKGEELNILIGSRPFKDDEASEKVKLNILKILNEKYGIIEQDFFSAELEAVPTFKAQDIGFDRSMLGSYGHDDRVCAYTAFEATMACDVVPDTTIVTVLTDKEEIGSDGNTGLQSSYLKFFICDLAECFGTNGRRVLSKSKCLSADVNAAFDPTFPEVNEANNAAFINHGVVITKYTGARGKSGTSDANAEFVSYVRSIMNNANVVWQTAELGKVDQGGGGTVAAYIANLNVDVIDVGVPVLSMHAPFEVVSKFDTYMAYRAFYEFFKSSK